MRLTQVSGGMETKITYGPPINAVTSKEEDGRRPVVLDIRINAVPSGVIVPGGQKLYCYWRNHLLLDTAAQMTTLYVPPEWRVIERTHLRGWIHVLRRWPFQTYSFGGTIYTWTKEFLIPEGQDPANIPLAGVNGWPPLAELPRVWGTPLSKLRSGTNLPIILNQIPRVEERLEAIACYWPMLTSSKKEPLVYVPPEWKQIHRATRNTWISSALRNKNGQIRLGGTDYIWHQNILAPKAQLPELICCMLPTGLTLRDQEISQVTEVQENVASAPEKEPTAEDLEVARILGHLQNNIPATRPPTDLPELTLDDVLSTLDNQETGPISTGIKTENQTPPPEQRNTLEASPLQRYKTIATLRKEYLQQDLRDVKPLHKRRKTTHPMDLRTSGPAVRDNILMLR